MSKDEEIAEVLTGLRRLIQAPSIEGARDVLMDWDGQREMYDQTDAVWRRRTPQEGL